MALQATFRPLVTWPGKPTANYARKRAAFRIGYAARLELLDHELSKLSARDIIIQAYFEAREIRNDGWPRTSARPKGPGIIVSFNSPKGPLSFPCDRYDAWEDNLYAIALSLEALRAVDRHGVTQNAEQYRGWQQLPAPAPAATGFSSALAAAAWINEQLGNVYAVGYLTQEGITLQDAYRAAARKLHPDCAGGSTEAFQRLQAAMRMIREGK